MSCCFQPNMISSSSRQVFLRNHCRQLGPTSLLLFLHCNTTATAQAISQMPFFSTTDGHYRFASAIVTPAKFAGTSSSDSTDCFSQKSVQVIILTWWNMSWDRVIRKIPSREPGKMTCGTGELCDSMSHATCVIPSSASVIQAFFGSFWMCAGEQLLA